MITGTITEIRETEKLYKFQVNGIEYTVKKSEVNLVEGLEVEFEFKLTKGNQKDDGTYWPDTAWANDIKILSDQNKITSKEKQSSIEKQAALRSACILLAQSSKIDQWEEYANKMLEWQSK